MKKEDAYETLRLRIVTNRVTPGEILNEKDLMAVLEIGRSPLREVLFRLQEQNLIKPLPRLGYLVTTLDLSEMRELIELRRELEGFAGQLAAGMDQPQGLRCLAGRRWTDIAAASPGQTVGNYANPSTAAVGSGNPAGNQRRIR